MIARSFTIATVIIILVGGALVLVGGALVLVGGALVLLTCAAIGVAPNLTYKDVSVGWAKVVPVGGYLSKDEFYEQFKFIARENAGLADDMTKREKALRKELTEVSTRLEQLLLAHQRPPDDGLTDEERLRRLQEASTKLEDDLGSRIKNGQKPNDDMTIAVLREEAETAQVALTKEWRRQEAQFKFGTRDKPPQSLRLLWL